MYQAGQGVPQDYGEAVRWHRKAAEQGLASAQYSLGVTYSQGGGVAQDDAEAVRLYRRAADHGQAAAMNNLGVVYSTGKGLLQDYVQAHMWYNLAAALKPPGEDRDMSANNREMVEEKMTPGQVAEAQRLAREWMEKHQRGE